MGWRAVGASCGGPLLPGAAAVTQLDLVGGGRLRDRARAGVGWGRYRRLQPRQLVPAWRPRLSALRLPELSRRHGDQREHIRRDRGRTGGFEEVQHGPQVERRLGHGDVLLPRQAQRRRLEGDRLYRLDWTDPVSESLAATVCRGRGVVGPG